MKNNSSALEAWLASNALSVLVWTTFGAVLSAIGFVAPYVIRFWGGSLSGNGDDWGGFGSYLGGTVGPLLTFITVIALLATLAVQRKESRENATERQERDDASAIEQKKRDRAAAVQAFENTFFAWLRAYRDLLVEIEILKSYSNGREAFRGRRALMLEWEQNLQSEIIVGQLLSVEQWWKNGGAEWAPYVLPAELLNTSRSMRSNDWLRSLPPTAKPVANSLVMKRWDDLYNDQEYNLDNLFRVLFRLLKWVDSQDPEILTSAQKWHYISIARSQLSWIELVYLFFNGLSERGIRFKVLCERYALFDNLTFKDAALENLRWHSSGKGATYAESAFYSSIARAALGLPVDSDEIQVKAMEHL
ncbi:putative phage abortive infection protein [Uliginosibacterium sp. 31-12]|uniref:putative phage abortive infection protein n=1 Tax=Uliginosibacterium sp. 31-12 TaxID=3062781 RepID=UPI0026E47072|nr:putative phage abortive infection protein [Uliginosibacterium sp. 31-12]MDO6385275.1 putative phage abortive infection protein [Uliginosibacterium sp. 31-12]